MKNEERRNLVRSTWYLVLWNQYFRKTKNQEPRTKNQEPRTKNQEPVYFFILHSQFFILHSQFFILHSSMNMAFIVGAGHSRALFIKFAQHIQNQVGVAHGIDVLLKLDR